ncbi:hypothetical protein J6590_074819 [Homalodisca vitripennis]|nr:hypothetical protein J6590_074819 [Homalodisca vitripennis]
MLLGLRGDAYGKTAEQEDGSELKELRDSVEDDLWGRGYKLAIDRFHRGNPTLNPKTFELVKKELSLSIQKRYFISYQLWTFFSSQKMSSRRQVKGLEPKRAQDQITSHNR